jgi:hypothetical protein
MNMFSASVKIFGSFMVTSFDSSFGFITALQGALVVEINGRRFL